MSARLERRMLAAVWRPMVRRPGVVRRLAAVGLALLAALVCGPARASGPMLEATPALLEFPAEGGEKVVTLRNAGGGPLRVDLAVLSGDSRGFSTEGVPAQTLAPGQEVRVRVAFTSDGRRRQAFGALQVHCDDPRGLDDPRTPEREHIVSVGLAAGRDGLLGALALSPLPAVAMLLALCCLPWRRAIGAASGRAAPSARSIPRMPVGAPKAIALGGALLPLGAAAVLCARFASGFGVGDGNYGMQFLVHRRGPWGLPMELHLGVDGLSVGLVLLTALLGPAAVLCPAPARGRQAGYFALLLLLEASLLGALCALDGLLLCGLVAGVIACLGLLVGMYGGEGRRRAAMGLVLSGALGWGLLLAAILALHGRSLAGLLVDGTPVAGSFDLVKLAYQNHFGGLLMLGLPFGKLVWLALLFALVVLLPVAPLHPLLPRLCAAAPPGVALLLVGVVCRVGIYGLLRLSYGALPDDSRWAATGQAALGVTALMLGGLRACAPSEARTFLGRWTVGQGGLALLGAASFTQAGFSGALLGAIGQGLIAGLLLYLLALPCEAPLRRAGLWVGMLAALGLPGLCGFVGVGLTLLGAFPTQRLATMVAVVLVAIVGVGPLRALRLALRREAPEDGRLATGGTLQAVPVLVLSGLAVLLGLHPAPLLSLIGSGVDDLLLHTGGLLP